MHDFGYIAPDTLEETLAILEEDFPASIPLAGGTCLIPQMRDRHLGSPYREKRRMRPERLVSLRRVKELREVGSAAGGWYLGAMTTVGSLAEGEIEADMPILSRVASRMASPEVRNVATVGGNLCNASPGADLLAPLLALRAQVHLVSVGEDRWLSVREFYKAPHRTVLGRGEILAGISVPADGTSQPWGVASYATHPRMGMTLVSAACVLENSTSEVRGRIAVTPSIGRPIELSINLVGNADDDRKAVREIVELELEKQSARARGCHYSRENPQIPVWYLKYRTVLAAQEAVWGALEWSPGEEAPAHEG